MDLLGGIHDIKEGEVERDQESADDGADGDDENGFEDGRESIGVGSDIGAELIGGVGECFADLPGAFPNAHHFVQQGRDRARGEEEGSERGAGFDGVSCSPDDPSERRIGFTSLGEAEGWEERNSAGEEEREGLGYAGTDASLKERANDRQDEQDVVRASTKGGGSRKISSPSRRITPVSGSSASRTNTLRLASPHASTRSTGAAR